VLHIRDHGREATAYRAGAPLDPDGVASPDWGRDLARAVRQDIENLIPSSGLGIQAATQSREWSVVRSTEIPSDGWYSPGSWEFLSSLRDRLEAGSEPWEVFWERILAPARPIHGRGFPDHDMAERLFMHYAWRCSWEYVPRSLTDAWREAFREILITDLAGTFVTAEERVECWNAAAQASNFVPIRRGDHPDIHQNTLVLKHSGDPSQDEVTKWRLLLPWGTVVSARTIYLDRASRSQLDGKFVLA
jgi:hypothetical protein